MKILLNIKFQNPVRDSHSSLIHLRVVTISTIVEVLYEWKLRIINEVKLILALILAFVLIF